MTKLVYYCDNQRHLTCTPYSLENLHRMAEEFGIKRHWFQAGAKYAHYDIPKRKLAAVRAQCRVVSARTILGICKGEVRHASRLTLKEQLIEGLRAHGFEELREGVSFHKNKPDRRQETTFTFLPGNRRFEVFQVEHPVEREGWYKVTNKLTDATVQNALESLVWA